MKLLDQTKAFFKAHGTTIIEKEGALLIAERPIIANEIERTCVWIMSQDIRKGRGKIVLEEDYLNRFKGITKKYPGAKLHLLVETTEDLTSEFRNKAGSVYRVRIQVPCQFFDMPFSWEVANAGASATNDLRKKAKDSESKRVPQSYRLEGSTSEGFDLVPDLLNEVEAANDNSQSNVWFVVAPAGYGKSVCFASLFERLYGQFQDSKRHFRAFPRPLPLVAAHLKEAAGPNVYGLIDAFIRTEFAGRANREYFDWMIDNGYGLMMLDGLDEVITRDSSFLEYLEDRMTSPNSHPNIIISIRDTLFETNDELSGFIADYGEFVKIIKIKEWDKRARRIHAWLHYEKRQPKKEEADSAEVAAYLGVIEKSDVLKRLAATPFYADLLITTSGNGFRWKGEIDKNDLIEFAIQGMCTREYGKTLDKESFPMEAFREWLEEIAIINYQTSGVSVQELRDLASLAAALASRELSEDEQKNLVEHITMGPFFKRSETSGRVEMTHELFAEFLAASRFVKDFERNPPKFAFYISQRPWTADSIFFSVLSKAFSGKLHQLHSYSIQESLSPVGFRNMVQLFALMPEGGIIIKDTAIPLDGARLQGVRFQGLDLRKVSFRSADLTSAQFIGCDLQGSFFEGAVLRKTGFHQIPQNGLKLAQFGDCEHFESILVDGGMIDEFDRMKKWLAAQTGVIEKPIGLCPNSRQLLFLFRKFINIDGQGRRDVLDKRGVLRGKQELEAAEMKDCLARAIEFGYLEEVPRVRIRRTSGPRYGEMVSFVKNQVASETIRSLLDSLCRIPGCSHVPTKSGANSAQPK